MTAMLSKTKGLRISLLSVYDILPQEKSSVYNLRLRHDKNVSVCNAFMTSGEP